MVSINIMTNGRRPKQFSQKDVFVSSENLDFENQKKGVAQKLITFIVKLRLTVYKDCDKDKSKHPLLMEWVVH